MSADTPTRASSWRFYEQPTAQQVQDLLATLPPTYGVAYADYFDYVQALPQQEKQKVAQPTQSGGTVKEAVYLDVWVLYMSVGGRVKMLEAAATANEWSVEFVPEPATPTGIAGVLTLTENRVTYRVRLAIHEADGRLVGSRTGVSSRTGDNAWEKAETAANGRAIGAFGIGVLPGSGVASLEEMQTALQEEIRHRVYGPGGSVTGSPGPSRDQLLQATLVAVEQIRQIRGFSVREQNERIRDFLVRMQVPESVYDPKADRIDWSQVNAAQLTLLRQSTIAAIVAAQAAEDPV